MATRGIAPNGPEQMYGTEANFANSTGTPHTDEHPLAYVGLIWQGSSLAETS